LTNGYPNKNNNNKNKNKNNKVKSKPLELRSRVIKKITSFDAAHCARAGLCDKIETTACPLCMPVFDVRVLTIPLAVKFLNSIHFLSGLFTFCKNTRR
jgi:hypothetical protein